MRLKHPRLPDPSESSEHLKLQALVSSWIARRDLENMKAGLVGLALQAHSSFLDVLFQENTNTQLRRYSRYLGQCERLAAALAQSDTAKTLHMATSFPAVASTINVLSAGFAYFYSDVESISKLHGADSLAIFTIEVAKAHGFTASLQITDRSGRSLLIGLTKILQTGERVSCLLLLSALNSEKKSILLVGHAIGCEDIGSLTADVLLLTGDFRLDDIDIHTLSIEDSQYVMLTEWCLSASDMGNRAAARRFERPKFGFAQQDTTLDPTSETRMREMSIGLPEMYWPSYITLPFRGTALIGFFDLLGFSAYLDTQWSNVVAPETILKLLRNNLADAGCTVVNLPGLKPPMNPEIRTISDSIIAFTPTHLGTDDVVSALATLVKLTQRLQCLSAELGFALRGALEVGEVYCDIADITGPGLARAVKLEGKIASSMRTIIGPNLLEELAGFLERNVEAPSKDVSLLEYIRPSGGGLWRARYDANVGRLIGDIHGRAHVSHQKKFAEFLDVLKEGWVDIGTSNLDQPLNEALRMSASSMRPDITNVTATTKDT
jgi:hypothetical protein